MGRNRRARRPTPPTDEPPRPELNDEFKAFFMRLAPRVMHYAARNASFDVAQKVTLRVARSFWNGRVDGTIGEGLLDEGHEAMLNVIVRARIVTEWGRRRQRLSPAAWARIRAEVGNRPGGMAGFRRNLVLANMHLALGLTGKPAPGFGDESTEANIPLDRDMETITDFLCRSLTDHAESELEERLIADEALFERVAPAVNAWLAREQIIAVLEGPRNSEDWVDRRAVAAQSGAGEAASSAEAAKEFWWLDYHIPEGAVELMWGEFCEMVGGA
jgi:hypothetical protein